MKSSISFVVAFQEDINEKHEKLFLALQEDINEKQHFVLHFRRTSMKSSIICFIFHLQEDRRKIPEGASLGLYREDGKEHRKPVYKQVEQ